MRAVRFNAVGRLALEEVGRPEPGPGEVLVRVEAAGICGTDRHIFAGEFSAKPPVTLGHEFCGIVEALGDSVSGLSLGDRITVDPNIACGRCAMCRAGRVNLCESLVAIGIHRDGGFADYAVVPQGQAFRLPENLDPLHGAFCEPLACCIHGVDMAAIKPGQSVVVLGGGVIGMLVVQLAKLAGADRVALSTRQAAKRRLAEELGATDTIDPSAGNVIAAISGASGLLPGGADVVIECAGVPETVSQAPWLARRGGTVVILGVLAPDVRVEISPFDVLLRELKILGSFVNPFTQGRSAELISSGAVTVETLISRRVRLSEAAGIIAAPAPSGEIRAIVVPD
ncbi:MAG TPA: zinc-dependent alcohol dehydrogenase family protein [Mesorhizobium sp.]|jgi:2-desacetyl-2-hydroxyethyl bacteriochlorophyllide A dehydrogenase|nr:zinc-dependent alcohol dehydrogenase family protein [Mesorhizobium sp.]